MPYFDASVSHYFDDLKLAGAKLLSYLDLDVERLRMTTSAYTDRNEAYNSAINDVQELIRKYMVELGEYKGDD